MTPRLQAIRERAEAATEGPWDARADQVKLMIHARDIPIGVSRERICSSYPHDPTNVADFKFMAHAREDVPYLLALVESQAREIEALRQSIATNILTTRLMKRLQVEEADRIAEERSKLE